MRIAILGAGAIGSLLGSFLQKSGADVVLVDPFQAHMEKIAKDGLKVTLKPEGKTEYVKMTTFTDPKDAGVVDMLIVLVKGPFTKSAVTGAMCMVGEQTVVATLQNGLGNELALQELFPDEKILYGMLNFTSQLLAPGEVAGDPTAPGYKVSIGAIVKEGPQVELAKEFADLLTRGGYPSNYAEDINNYVWKKASNNVPCNGLCGVLRLTVGNMYTHESGKRIMHASLREFIDVGHAMGVDLDFDQVIDAFENGALKVVSTHYPSLAQDVMHKKGTEIETLNGAICKYGRLKGIPTPTNDLIADLVRVIQDHYEDQF